jgi:hypothetical protein
MNQKPDIAHKWWNVLSDPDEIAVSVPDKTGQPGHARSGPRGDHMLADAIQSATHRAFAGNAEQPPLLWHVREALIKSSELTLFRRTQMGLRPVRVRAKGRCPNL